MRADDKRHGSEAGYEQHLRDGEDPCHECVDGDLKAGRRRNKRIVQGYVYTLPLGPRLVAKLARARNRGATYDQIAERAGLAVSQVFTFCNAGPEYAVYTRTHRALTAMHEGPYLTPIGITRRLQGLARLGYSAPVIATHCGVHRDTIADATHGPRDFLAGKVSTAIVEMYERLSMQLPPEADRYQRSSACRIRRMAERRGYHPPLSWDDDAIDDPNATPHVGTKKRNPHHEQTDERHATLADLDGWGYGISEACRRLNTSRDALQAWSYRHGEAAVYQRLVERENYAEKVNGSTAERRAG